MKIHHQGTTATKKHKERDNEWQQAFNAFSVPRYWSQALFPGVHPREFAEFASSRDPFFASPGDGGGRMMDGPDARPAARG